ncbi:Low molecular weight phosphotyrosine protein phosphatase [Verticillium dahliae VDG1]|nr:Low molecular weight phosphotyrosine protein phosphatase [Verticillium dahliae VDG1]
MTGRYERVHAQDEDDSRTRSNITPNSPPPSFHSRQSSRERSRVDPTLADAFDTDGDDSDDEGDDRQRLPERATEEKEEMPPTYEQAALDAAPPYWETTILAPGLGGADEVYIDGMPVGSLFSFLWNAMISMFFQLVGFLLTYLLHSSHASKNGSLAGLGIQMIQYGFYLRGGPTEGDNAPPMNGEDGYASPPDPNSHNFNPDAVAGEAGGIGDMSGSDWISYILMIVGWFILIRSISEFLRARRHEQLVMQSPDRGLPVPIIATGESTERVV